LVVRTLTRLIRIAGAALLAVLVVTGCASARATASIAIGTVQLRAPGTRHAGALMMHTVTQIPIPAEAMTRFNPDSFHLLITGAGAMRDGKDITLKLTFANAGTVTILAMVTNPESGGSSYFLN
jgi:hypothetical protein